MAIIEPAAYCQQCGFRYKINELKARWDGLTVCEADWEPKPVELSDYMVVDKISVKNARPEWVGVSANAAITWDKWKGYWEYQTTPWGSLNQ